MGNRPTCHAMCVYNTRDYLLLHALHYLKEGLDNNENCMLITDYLTKSKARDMMTSIWGARYVSGLKGTNDIKIVSGSQWYFRGRPSTFNIDYVMESWSNLSDSGMKNGKHGVRAFADVGIFFRRESVQDLVEYESIFARVQLFSLKVICAYLVSDLSLLTDLSLLSLESYKTLQESHGHIYLIPDRRLT
jgi:hypothetical protein